MTTLLDNYGSEAARDQATASQAAENQTKIDAALEVARKYKAETGSQTANNDDNIRTFNTEINVTLEALRKYARPDESDVDVAIRGRESNDLIFRNAAVSAISAQSKMEFEMQGRQTVLATKRDELNDLKFAEVKRSRDIEIKGAAMNIMRRDGISLPEATRVVLAEIEVDGLERVLPRHAKIVANAESFFAAQAADDDADIKAAEALAATS